MESNTGQIISLGSLYQRFCGLKDKRKAKGKRYALATTLVGTFLAKLCDKNKPSGIAQVLGLRPKSLPSHHTIAERWRTP